jgi:hypothetical protein
MLNDQLIRARSYRGVVLLGEANREASSDGASPYPELSPTCAGPGMSKRQRVEWASCVNPAPYLNAYGIPGLKN